MTNTAKYELFQWGEMLYLPRHRSPASEVCSSQTVTR